MAEELITGLFSVPKISKKQLSSKWDRIEDRIGRRTRKYWKSYRKFLKFKYFARNLRFSGTFSNAKDFHSGSGC